MLMPAHAHPLPIYESLDNEGKPVVGSILVYNKINQNNYLALVLTRNYPDFAEYRSEKILLVIDNII